MINPPQVRPEEPTAVTPHGGICGGKSQQWLSYPTKPHVRFCAGCALKAHETMSLEMATAVKLSRQPRTESCVVSGNGLCEA
jgi:hypothetical protein